MKRIYSVILLSLVLLSSAFAQGYKIDVNIEGLKDSIVLLGYHFGEKKFVADTAYVNSNGVALFKGESNLPGGMYIVILPQRSYFDILLTENQKFSIKTSVDNMLEDLKFENSPENTAFANYQRFMSAKQKRMGELREKMESVKGNTDAEKAIVDEITALDAEVNAYWDKSTQDYSGSLFANIVKSLKPIEMPQFDVPVNASNPDSLRWIMSYKYNQNHYFDNTDLTDDRLIRTPFFQSRLDMYFDRVLLPIPDTVMLYAKKVIEKTRSNPEMFQFILSHLFSKYQNSSIMGMDAVFVFLAEEYYLAGQTPWISESILGRVADRVNDLKPNLIGAIAPDVRMQDIKGQFHNLHSINAKITVIYFWEPGCSHCKKVTPLLNEAYKKFKAQGLEVFAVYTQHEKDKWEKYITDNSLTWLNVWDPTRQTSYHKLYDIYSTPILYVLDKDKKIIAKRIGIESLEKIITEELKL